MLRAGLRRLRVSPHWQLDYLTSAERVAVRICTIYGGAAWVKYDSTAAAQFCTVFGVNHPGAGATYSCNPNYSVGLVGLITRWNPVKNLTLSG